MSEMVEAATSFKKSGFSDEDSATLATISSMFANVADGAVSASESADFLISQMIAFGIEADNAISIVDKVNEVSNRYAVSSTDLSKALGVVASTSSAMGNSIDETLGVVTAITEITRNSSKAARGANAIFASLAQILDENSSNGKKIIEIFDGLGVAMYDSQGQMLSAFDLLKGMSERWDNLDSNTQKYIATTIAGTTQLNNFLALMNNFDHALSATETSLDSVGSATEENARVMESLEARWTAVKAEFQELATTVIDSGLVKTILDLAKAFLELANTGVGRFLTQTTLLGGVLWGGTGLIKAMGIIPNLLGGFAQAAGVATGATTALGTAASISAPHLFLIAAAISAVIGLAPHVVDWFKKATDEVYRSEEKLKELNDELLTNQTRLEELNAIPAIDRTSAIQKEIDALEEKNKQLQESIDKENEELRLAKFKQEVLGTHETEGSYIYQKADRTVSGAAELVGGGNDSFVINAEDALDKLVEIGAITREKVNEVLAETNNDVIAALDKLGYELSIGTADILAEDYYKDKLSKLQDFANELTSGVIDVRKTEKFATVIQEFDEIFQTVQKIDPENVPEWLKEMQNQFEELIDIAPQMADVLYNVEDSVKALDEGLTINNLQYNQLISKYPALTTLLEDVGSGYKYNAQELGTLDEYIRMHIGSENSLEGAMYRVLRGMEITEAQLNTLKQLYPEIDSVVRQSSQGYYVEIQALSDLASAGSSWAISMISSQKGVTKAVVDQAAARVTALKAELRAVQNEELITGIHDPLRKKAKRDALERAKEEYNNIYSLYEIANRGYSVGNNIPTGGGGGGSTSKPKPEDPIKKQSEAFKEQIELMEHRLFLMEKEGKSEQSRIDYIKKIQAEIERQKKWYYSKGLNANSEYIQELEKQWWQYEEEIKELYKDQAKIYEQLFSAVVDRADEEIKALEAKKDAIKKENEELEEQIRLQEALDALARAKQNKVMVFKDGRMQYVSDVDAISAAQKDLDEIRREEALNQQLESIDKEIDKWEQMKDQWGSITSEYKKFQDRLLIEQKLGIKLEGDNWEKRLGNLQTYVNKYNELMSKANAIGKVSGATVKPFNPSSRYAYGGSSRSVPLSAYSGAQTFSLMSGGLEQTGWGMGNLSPSDLMSGAINGMRSMAETIMVQIENFNPNLPNVTNGEDFVNYLANNLWRQTFQLSKV